MGSRSIDRKGGVLTQWFDEAFCGPYLTLYKHRTDTEAAADIDWLASEVCLGANAHVLDLCCGNGRHSVHIAKIASTVVGMDRSADLLQAAGDRGASTIRWVRGDMRSLFTSFGYFEDDTDDAVVLSEIARVLKPQGVAVLDLMNAQRIRETLVAESESTREGWSISEKRRLTRGGSRVEKEVELVNRDGETSHWTESVRLHDSVSMAELLKGTGLRIKNLFGSMAGADHSEDSERTVFVLEKTLA